MNNITSSLKIGIVVDQLLAGGVQFAAIEQVRELNKLGHKAMLLILMRKKYPTDFSFLVDGIPNKYLSDSYPPFFRNTIKLPIFSFLSTLHLMSPILAPQVIKKREWDILVSHGTTTCLTTQAIYRIQKIPYIAIIHDPIEYILDKVYSKTSLKLFFPVIKPLSKFFENSFVKDALETIIDSKVHFKYILKNYKKSPKILELGARIPSRISYKRGSYILSFGRWQKEKNPEFLLMLLKSLPKIKMIIAGSWKTNYELNQFKEKIDSEHLRDRVDLVTHYSDKELSELCKKSRVFIHPHFEAFGLAALEAAAHGLPIIIPEKSGVTEKFIHGKHGFFPTYVDVKEYKKYIKILLMDSQRAEKMGHEAANLVKKEFSWTANANTLLSIIKSLFVERIKPKIIAVETGHIKGTSLAGGDRLMEPMAIRIQQEYEFEIIIPEISAGHWSKAPMKKILWILPRNRFDEKADPISVFLTYLIRMWQSTKKLEELLNKKTQTSTITYSSTNILPDVLPLYLAKRFNQKLKWIARIHHLIPHPNHREGRLVVNSVSYLMQILALFMIKSGANIIIALNETLKHDLESKGFPKEKIRVLGAGIDLAKIKSQKVLNHAERYEGIFLGRLHPSKGIFDLVPIWKSVVTIIPDVKLALIGEGPEYPKQYLQKLIYKNNLHKNIYLLGYLPDSEVYSLMKKSKVFLFTDHEAGWGVAVAEAMACGLPIVGYDIGILGTVYKKGFLKVALSDYKSFSENVVKILKDKRLQSNLSKEVILESKNLDWSETTVKFRKIVDNLSNIEASINLNTKL